MRPAFHFTARTGWINDPHGIVYRDGEYQAFFQYVPDSLVWAPNCHWGHARGIDLLSLTELPVALAPGEGDDGIWTGCLVTDDAGTSRIFYTATSTPDFGIGRIRVAHPDDPDWVAWSKGDVVVEAPAGVDLIAFRDPFVRREGEQWRMFVGAGGRDGTAMALSWVSDDLAAWRYDGVTLARSTAETDPVWMGALWECPQIFPLGDRWVMVSSVWDADNLHYVGYALGCYDDGGFRAESWGRLTYGTSYYAPSLFTDAGGRPCLSFWMRGIADADAGWAGAHSVPHVLTLEGDRLVATPHPDVERYRAPVVDPLVIETGASDALDLVWRPSDGDRLSLTRGGEPLVEIEADPAGLRIGVGGQVTELPAGGEVRVIVDGPVLEVSAPGGAFGAALPATSGPVQVQARGVEPTVYRLVR